MVLAATKLDAQLIPVGPGQADIEQRHGRTERRHQVQRGLSVVRDAHGEPARLERQTDRACRIEVVVDDEDLRRVIAGSRRLAPCGDVGWLR